jgi:hypothetical protein
MHRRSHHLLLASVIVIAVVAVVVAADSSSFRTFMGESNEWVDLVSEILPNEPRTATMTCHIKSRNAFNGCNLGETTIQCGAGG